MSVSGSPPSTDIDLAAEPSWRINNVVRGLESLPVRVT